MTVVDTSTKITAEQAERALAMLIENGWGVTPDRARAWLREHGLDDDEKAVLAMQINLATFDWLTVRCDSCRLSRLDRADIDCAAPSWHSTDAIAGLGLAEVLA